LRNDSGNRTYIIATNRITSGDKLKYRKGRIWVWIDGSSCQPIAALQVGPFALTTPIGRIVDLYSPHERAKYFAAVSDDAT